MPKYKLNHLLLGTFTGIDGERTALKPGTVVTEAQLREAGYHGKDGHLSVGDLLRARPGGFAPPMFILEGSEDYIEPAAVSAEPVTGGMLDTDAKPTVTDDGADSAASQDQIETLKVAELRARALAAGITNAQTMKKDELLTALGGQ